jgi:hypothetical protein
MMAMASSGLDPWDDDGLIDYDLEWRSDIAAANGYRSLADYDDALIEPWDVAVATGLDPDA